jgi:hypothetical protein
MYMHQSSQWCRNKHLNMLSWRDARVMCDDWVYFRTEEKKPYVIMDAMESFHHFFSWSTVSNTNTRQCGWRRLWDPTRTGARRPTSEP